MGMEVPVVEPASESGFQLDNDGINIQFGSHGIDEPVKGDVTGVPEYNLPKDAADEWTQPKQIHSFSIVRYPAFVDQNLKARMELAEKELQNKNQSRLQVVEKIKAKRADRAQVIAQLRILTSESKQYRTVIQGEVKLIGVDHDGVSKEKQLINAKLKCLDEEKIAIDSDISALEDELAATTEKRDRTFETVRELRKQRDDGNTPYYQNRALLNKAKSLAADKDIDALIDLCNAEEENFMSLWNSNVAFRDEYVRPSPDTRRLSGDARSLVQVQTSTIPETEVIKAGAKQTPKDDIVPKEKSSKKQKEGKKPEDIVEKNAAVEEDEVFFVDKQPEESKEEVDKVKLKELKREEEMAKRAQAEERKKKLAEKAAAKAALKAQKEAEKKLKEREKRARKKAGGSAATAESEEPAETVEKEETAEIPVSQKRKENVVKQRTGRRGVESLPKGALKRKKAGNYWMWAAPAAAAVLLLLIACYAYIR